MTMISDTPATLHSSQERAQDIADRCNRDDEDGWRYAVEQRGRWFAIVVFDETDQRLGGL
jgi:hypothetical protein